MATDTIDNFENYFTTLGISRANREFLKILVKSPDDLQEFTNCYWSGRMKQGFAVMSYREKKIAQQRVSCQDFIRMYGDNKRDALESLFLCPVSEDHIRLLEKKLHSGLTLVWLYDMHLACPTHQLARLIL